MASLQTLVAWVGLALVLIASAEKYRRWLPRALVLALVLTALSIWVPYYLQERSLKSTRRKLSNAFVEVSLICHSWKNEYFVLSQGDVLEEDGKTGRDVWDLMARRSEVKRKYSVAERQRFLPLFAVAIDRVVEDLDKTALLYPEIIPTELKAQLITVKWQLKAEQATYCALPSLISSVEDKDAYFSMRFISVIRQLSNLSRSADKLSAESAL